MNGRTLTIFVMGNSASSLKSVEIGNRTLKAFLGGRQFSHSLKTRPELSEPAVYLLLNDSSDDTLTQIYVGETDDCASRISTHASRRDWDWWTKFIVFTGKNLTKAHVRHLERELFLIAKQSTAIEIMNSTKSEPGGTSLPEYAISDMKEFLEDILFTLETLGLGYFDQSTVPPIAPRIDQLISPIEGQEFYFYRGSESKKESGTNANLVIQNGSYILKRGSKIKRTPRQSFEQGLSGYYELWKKIVSSSDVSLFSEQSDYLQTTRDLEFRSPSAAAAIVNAASMNGRVSWRRISDDKSIADIEGGTQA